MERGIVTQEEFDTKLNKLKQDNALVTKNAIPVLSKEQSAMLEKLQILFDRGILTSEEFEKKKQQIYQEAKSKQQEATKLEIKTAESSQKPILTSSSSQNNSSSQLSFQEYSQQLQDLKNMMNETQRTQMKALDRFLNDGILNQEEYETKKKKVLSSLYFPTQWTHHKKIIEMEMSLQEEKKSLSPSTDSSIEREQMERIAKLEKLTEKGTLTPEMLESKKQQIMEENKPVQDTEDFSHLSHDQQVKISKLKHLKKMGILTQEEFDSQFQKLLNSQSPSSPTTTISNMVTSSSSSSSPTQSNNNGHLKLKSPTTTASSSSFTISSNNGSVKLSSPSSNLSTTFRVEEKDKASHSSSISSPSTKESPRDVPKDIIIPKTNKKDQTNSPTSTPSKKLERVQVKEVSTSPSSNSSPEPKQVSKITTSSIEDKPTTVFIKSSSTSPQKEQIPSSVQTPSSESAASANKVTPQHKPHDEDASTAQFNDEEDLSEIQEQLENLRSLVEMGVISEKDYLEKEERLLKGMKALTPSPTTKTTTTIETRHYNVQQEAETNAMQAPSHVESTSMMKTTKEAIKEDSTRLDSNTVNTNNQIKQLEKLLNAGVISKDVFDEKVKKILGGNGQSSTPMTPTRNVESQSVATSPVEPKIVIPNSNKGQDVTKTSTPQKQRPASPTVESPRQVQTNGNSETELAKLKKLLNCGLITEEQYKMKEAKLIGNSTTPTNVGANGFNGFTTPEKVVSPPSAQPMMDEPTKTANTTSTAQQISNLNQEEAAEIDPVFGDLSSLNEEQKHQVKTLRQFLKEGLIDQEEFEEEVNQIIQSSR